ncbi:MAG: hypothetical protein EOM17_16270 [Synergistales bacterium]|nr:hypothetical protein [Synergistales bacterium]
MVIFPKNVILLAFFAFLLFCPCYSCAEPLELTGKISKVDRSLKRMELNQGNGIRFPVLWNDKTVFLDGKDRAISANVFFDRFSSAFIWLHAVKDGEDLLALTVSVSLEIQ